MIHPPWSFCCYCCCSFGVAASFSLAFSLCCFCRCCPHWAIMSSIMLHNPVEFLKAFPPLPLPMEQSKQFGNFVLAFVGLFHCSAYNALKSHLPFFAAQVILADFPSPLPLSTLLRCSLMMSTFHVPVGHLEANLLEQNS